MNFAGDFFATSVISALKQTEAAGGAIDLRTALKVVVLTAVTLLATTWAILG